jgi:hypothetical protein
MSQDLQINPARIVSFPPTFPIDLVMRIKPVPELCKMYDITRDDWNRIRHDPLFIKTLEQLAEELEDPKRAFKMKARLQAEAYLTTAWDLVHSPNAIVAPPVKAQLIRDTWRAAGLDGSMEEAGARPGNALQINIVMGDD